MNTDQKDRLTQYALLQEVFEEHQQLIDSKPALARDVVRFTDNLHSIGQKGLVHHLDSQGKTDAKKMARAKLASSTLEIASEAAVYAEHIADVELEQLLTSVTRSKLLYRDDQQTLVLARRVLDAVRSVQPAMAADYGLSAEELDKLAEEIEAYQDLINAPAATIDKRSVATAEIKEAFTDNDRLIRKCFDRYMVRFQRTHPEFAAAYAQARDLIRRRTPKERQEERQKVERRKQQQAAEQPAQAGNGLSS